MDSDKDGYALDTYAGRLSGPGLNVAGNCCFQDTVQVYTKLRAWLFPAKSNGFLVS
jgi:hypothetical protein